eukprot:2241391-Amphidinium_carterae.1
MSRRRLCALEQQRDWLSFFHVMSPCCFILALPAKGDIKTPIEVSWFRIHSERLVFLLSNWPGAR